MKAIQKISDSLEEALTHPGLQDSAAALAEIALDSLLDPGLVKDVPIVGTFVALTRATLAIRDRLFLKSLSPSSESLTLSRPHNVKR